MSNCDSVPALLQILSTWAEAKRVEQFFADAHCLHPNGLICVQAVIGRPAHMGRRQPTALSPAHRRQDPAYSVEKRHRGAIVFCDARDPGRC